MFLKLSSLHLSSTPHTMRSANLHYNHSSLLALNQYVWGWKLLEPMKSTISGAYNTWTCSPESNHLPAATDTSQIAQKNHLLTVLHSRK